MMGLIDLVKDPYERKARLAPGLLVALPLLVLLVCVYGPRQPVLTAVVSLLGGCGTMYALASIARGRGKKLEDELIKEWGGMPTTIALRHRDTSVFDAGTKKRYHEAIKVRLGIAMPTAAEETADPASADEIYIGATRRLRELTRGDKSLLLKENIAYGFHRNMVGMKSVGVGICILALVLGLVMANVIDLAPFAVAPGKLAHPGLGAALTMLVAIALLLAWLFYFDRDAVRRIGFAYAERLFECLSSLSAAPGKRPSKKSAAP